MSRYATMSMSQPAVASNMLNSIAAKETSYREGIKRNHALSRSLADRLNKDGGNSLEDTLVKASKELMDVATTQSSTASILDENKIQRFLQEQRDRLKALAIKNMENERTTTIFCSAIMTLKDNMENQQGDVNDIPDYQELLEDLMEQERVKQERGEIVQEENQYYREMCEAMGELDASARAGGSGNDDDEDICVMAGQNNAGASLKCPITGMFMEDPVRNKVCHHVYSREGILQHIRTKGGRNGSEVACPMAGCNNNRVTQQQLEDDIDTQIKVRHQQRRQRHEAERMASQASQVMDDDDEE